MKKTISIEGMSCGHCTGRVEKALSGLENVKVIEVSVDAKHAVVETTVEDSILKETVEDAGYDVIGIQ
jgi:copper chaperone CopZ